TASFVPDTIRCNSELSLSLLVGLIMNLSSIIPTKTEPIGPSKGIFDIVKAIDDPIIATISGVQSWSTERTVAITCTSFLYPSGNRGLIGLSINLDVTIAFSLGLPSLLIKPPGIFPTEYNLSSKSTLNGKKSIPSLGSLDAVAVTNTTVSPY